MALNRERLKRTRRHCAAGQSEATTRYTGTP
jgi:hypothetical protein